jgi:hypothetical protein
MRGGQHRNARHSDLILTLTGNWQPDPSWGFHGSLLGGAYTGYLTYSSIQVSCPRPPNYSGPVPNGQKNYGYVYHDAFGKKHAFNYTFQICPLTPPATITGNRSSSDGSGLSYGISDGLVHTRNGSVIHARRVLLPAAAALLIPTGMKLPPLHGFIKQENRSQSLL